MKSIFSSFDSFKNADDAVRQLREVGFKSSEINVLIQDAAAKANMEDVDMESVHVDVTDAIGERELGGLALLVANEQPVNLPDVGPLLAGGELATILTNSTDAQNQTGGTLAAMLVDFGLSEEAAESYRDAVGSSGVMIWVRSEEDQAGKASAILKDHNGQQITSN